MFGTSGIRGRFGDPITTDLALQVGRAVGSTTDTTVAVIGRDPRTTGALLSDALSAGLREIGVDVIDIGVAATPTIARCVAWQNADIGISVTASHNPPTDNGFKLWNPSGQAFNASQRAAITDALENEEAALADWNTVGQTSTWNGAKERHVATLVAAVSVPESLSVVVDVGNGAGGLTADALVELGCDVTTLNAQEDGRFPGRASEPNADTLDALMTQVAGSDADLGIAHDGDADRMMAVDETGAFVMGDELLALFGRQAASAGDEIAAPVNTSLVVDDTLATIDASVTRTKVGDVHVAAATTREDVVFGGEPSGAWIWPTETLCPDGPLAAVKLVELIAEEGPLSAQRKTLDQYPLERDSIPTEHKARVFEHVTDLVKDAYEDVQTLDGVRVSTPNGWFLIRPSGTQPLIRVTAQARTTDDCQALLEEATNYVTDAHQQTTN
ncbi:phosphoglucosamine mutase [Halobacterium salinarum]|jgi:phosphoglucosamine mutase|uniref:phosphoglucosamine mutase n=1 Tax=Halobacterium salinarum TaxID=2242 RepID=UPI002554EB03|nr:phosphoglucosamine mutase [Halobacterium salinarum]MDL0125608.1 phosphoglucosamine mutase [Halobacterium salinarum]MDL0129855.1 phosphoglucosamine mutase [Halobacterium salinarum]MDL0137991.1 phosphoglucosamine mutase [Halobacterium salinarum]